MIPDATIRAELAELVGAMIEDGLPQDIPVNDPDGAFSPWMDGSRTLADIWGLLLETAH
jgi:hypothetical protein